MKGFVKQADTKRIEREERRNRIEEIRKSPKSNPTNADLYRLLLDVLAEFDELRKPEV